MTTTHIDTVAPTDRTRDQLKPGTAFVYLDDLKTLLMVPGQMGHRTAVEREKDLCLHDDRQGTSGCLLDTRLRAAVYVMNLSATRSGAEDRPRHAFPDATGG